jgi:acyl carrier protein
MFEKIKSKLLEYVEYPEENITESTEVIKDLNMNSFDVMSMLGEIEDEFGITFEQEDIQNAVTVGDLIDCINRKLK